MRSFFQKKWVKIPYQIALYSFAIYGFFLVGTYLAMKFKLTNDAGSVDVNNRYYQQIHDKYNQSFKIDSSNVAYYRNEILSRIHLLNEYFPKNANDIMDAWTNSKDDKLALQMLAAIDLKMKDNKGYQKEIQEIIEKKKTSAKASNLSVFDWTNIMEWKYFKEAVAKDKRYIDSAAKVAGVEARYIVACLVGEQVRLFNSRRERFKNFVAPLKSLALETNHSYGVTGIKENTAKNIEFYLVDSTSKYYLGKKYKHALDYDSTVNYSNKDNDTNSVRIQRLVQYKNHYYSYLYAAFFIKQIRMQWQRAGFPIDDRPEIFASLFNLGFVKSVPKKNPSVGGSNFKIRDQEYTFGSVAYEFYYSGEMSDMFPFEKVKFKD
ncbi:MAG: hypothetical protein NWR96_01765 [Crocinitomicaceae bacterium]|jgi:hypothetical protein|nr:hypothetical protein [Crocinitomicaceae bacterium]